MIMNRFGRIKRKNHKYRDGLINYQYEDQHLQALRSIGHRFSEFSDYSVGAFHPQQQEEDSDSLDSESLKGSDDESNKRGNKKKKKTKVQKFGKKIKKALKNKYKQNRQKVQNFIMISGEEKNLINKKRYCLHQMTRETDKTQALINFIQLVFAAYWPKGELFDREKDLQEVKKKRMTYFVHNFKVKRCTTSCLKEYTRESFLHKVLNLGLRVFNSAHELTYLRLPFSHIFWSIKTLYQRHKRAIFKYKSKKNEKRVIKLYRGFHMDEITKVKQNIGAYIEIEGFLSATLCKKIAIKFRENAFMSIEVPIINLNGMHDNGFAHISSISEHPSEKEVLFNAFNTFKILSLRVQNINKKDIYEITLEYGGVKQVEDKVRRSENLLESQFLMKLEEQKIENVKHLLNMKEEKMTSEMVVKLRDQLVMQEKKLKKWKDTLKKQEEQEFTKAYKKLNEWEQEILDNYIHQAQTIQYIDNYGQLLVSLEEYERGATYCERMLKQVWRDRVIEGWKWKKTPCLPEKEQRYRLLLAECYNKRCIYQQQVRELQKIKQMYTCMNMNKSSHPSYTKLLNKLASTYDHLKFVGYSKQYDQCEEQCMRIGLENEVENINKLHQKIELMRMEELQGRIQQQRDKLERIRIHTHGQYNNHYLSQHYLLIYMLFIYQRSKYPEEKRDYEAVKVESMRYFTNRKSSQHSQQTISLFNHILLEIVEKSRKGGAIQLQIVCKHFISFLAQHIYHKDEVDLIERCVRLCMLNDSWMTLQQLLNLKLREKKILCPITNEAYDSMMMIYVFLWSTSKPSLDWVSSNEQEVYQRYKIYRIQPIKQFVHFPYSIANWGRKQKFRCVLDNFEQLSYRDVIKRCQQLSKIYKNIPEYNFRIERQLEHLRNHLHQSILIFYLHDQRKKVEQKELRKVLGESNLEGRLWQQPCAMWNTVYGQYGVFKYIVKGDLMMAMQYLQHQHSHPHYLRAKLCTSQLHRCRESYRALDIKYSHMENQDRKSRKIRMKDDNIAEDDSESKLQQVLKQRNKQEKITIIESYTYDQIPHYSELSKVWRQVSDQLQLLEGMMMDGNFHHFAKTKQSCQLLVRDIRDMGRVVGLWTGHQRGLGFKRLGTMERLHGKSPLPQRSLEAGKGSSLSSLIGEEIEKQITGGCYLEQEELILAVLKGMVRQHSLPMKFMWAFFYKWQRCKQILSLLLWQQAGKQQLKQALEQFSPRLELLLQLLSSQKITLLTSYLEYRSGEQSCDDGHNIGHNIECMRYGVLKILVDRYEFYPFLMQLLSPIIHYSSMKQEPWQMSQEFEREYHKMKEGYEALVEACMHTKSCLHHGWSTPRWWPLHEK